MGMGHNKLAHMYVMGEKDRGREKRDLERK